MGKIKHLKLTPLQIRVKKTVNRKRNKERSSISIYVIYNIFVVCGAKNNEILRNVLKTKEKQQDMKEKKKRRRREDERKYHHLQRKRIKRIRENNPQRKNTKSQT